MKTILLLLLIHLTAILSCRAPEIPQHYAQKQVRVQTYLENLKREQRVNALLQVIRLIESNNQYDVYGGSGEYGAYQFTHATWKAYCLLYEGVVLDIKDKKNQDLIARKKIEDLVDKGLTNAEIFSFWNSGKTDWKNRVGVNVHGISYDVPAYVDKSLITLNNLHHASDIS